MWKSELKLAWKVLWRRRFFTAISLFGISLTLVVLTVAVALLDHRFAPEPPESRINRVLLVQRTWFTGPHSMWSDSAGFRLLDRFARGLPGVERLAMVSTADEVYSYQTGERIESSLRRCDAEFWRVLDFRFVEGGPFVDQDVDNRAFVAVINTTTRDRFFGGSPSIGRWIEANGQRFRVIGVIEDVSEARYVSAGDIFVPLTTEKTDEYRAKWLGSYTGLLLARTSADFPAIRAEFASRIQAVPMPSPELDHYFAPLETLFEVEAGRRFRMRDNGMSQAHKLVMALVGICLIFMVLPAVNLVNINVSRILERSSEIGVRKAFGAPVWMLLRQFIIENLVLTAVGSALGLLASAAVLWAIGAAGFIEHARLTLNLRVFVYAVGLALIFGLVSSVYPAWRMARLHPVAALKGARR